MLQEQPQGTDYTLFLRHFISLSVSLFLVSELIFHRLAVDSARLCGFTDFWGRVAAIWQQLCPAAAPGTRYRCLSRLSDRFSTAKRIKNIRQQILCSLLIFFLHVFMCGSKNQSVHVCSYKHTHITPPGLSEPLPLFFEPAKGEQPKMDIDKCLRLDETR